MNKQSLQELRDKVAAGVYDATNTRVAQFNRFARGFERALGSSDYVRFAWQAYNSSQDAAVALLEAVLPEWDAEIRTKKSWACRVRSMVVCLCYTGCTRFSGSQQVSGG